MLNGYGRSQYANGDIYQGEFRRGAMEGFGLYYKRESDTCILGVFKNNKLANEIDKYEHVDLNALSFSSDAVLDQ